MSARIVLNPTTSASSATVERAKAQLWLNPGIRQKGNFIGLPMGIPLDTMEPNKITGTSEFQQYLALGNALLTRLLDRSKDLNPGETLVIGGEADGDICFQIRRIKDEIPSSSITTDLVTPW